MPLDEIKVCIHVDADHCECRKPKPGMLLDAAAERRIDLDDGASWSATDGATSRPGRRPVV